MILRAAFAIVALLCTTQRIAAAASHPQDGPHADLRVAIEDDLVRFSVGVNLAFLDEVAPVPREAINEVNAREADLALEALERLLIDRAPCVINGDLVPPTFERLEIFTDPDPGMIAIFPNMGARALIRATAVMRFDADEPVETVELTWPAYPFDQLAERMERASAVRPRMYFEAVFIASGKSSAARFTHAEPTIRWSRTEADAPDPLRNLPTPTPSGFRGVPITIIVLGAAALAAMATAAMVRTPRAWITGCGIAAVSLGLAVALHDATGLRIGGKPSPVSSEADAKAIFLTIHEAMYRAFDYTAESDIYDRLEMALDGQLLGELYEQIRLSLLQAEEEMKVGVVTGLRPLDTHIVEIDRSTEDPIGLGFDTIHQWRVDGTVYHWGHSHTRAHLYKARYRVTWTDRGWRLTDHELRSQQRIDPADGTPIDETTSDADPVQQILEQLGRPDI
ncbi:MAG: hypothetical protein AAGK04_03230 [Planctomycetota bacterium]